MKRKEFKSGVMAAALIALASAASAQQAAAAAATPAIDADAVAALDKMGAYLRSVKTFQVKATTTRDRVQDDGQLVKVDGSVDILAQFPSHLRIDATNDKKNRVYLYDGKTFTLYGKVIGYYATVPAPSTVKELADVLADKYDIHIPLEDLFWWGTERVSSSSITAASDAGPSDVMGTTCEHYTFRQEGIDWQIWIQLGDYPLPRKLVITTLTDEARPQYSAVYSWNLAPSFNEAAFTFDPPADAHKIVMASADDAGK